MVRNQGQAGTRGTNAFVHATCNLMQEALHGQKCGCRWVMARRGTMGGTSSLGPMNTMRPSDSRHTSSNRLKTSGAGCSSDMNTVACAW